jgi:hypothetical protein
VAVTSVTAPGFRFVELDAVDRPQLAELFAAGVSTPVLRMAANSDIAAGAGEPIKC